jgi:hypothetical protein
MSNTRSFSDFDSPDSGTTLSTTEAGVLLTDTLEDFREKTNGIVEKVKAIDAAYAVADTDITTAYVSADTAIKAGGLNVNALDLDKIEQIAVNNLLGNVAGTGDGNVAEVQIDVAGSLQDSDDAIPTSKAVRDYADTADAAIKAGGLDTNSVALTKIAQVSDNKLLGNVSGGTANVSEIEIDVTVSGLQDSDDTIPSSKAVREYVDTAISTKLDSSTFTAFEATSATTHYINAYGGGGATNLNWDSITTAQSEFIATAMTGVVATGHFVMARVNQYYSWGGGNGTGYGHRQMFVVLSVTSLDGAGKPTFNAVAGGHV